MEMVIDKIKDWENVVAEIIPQLKNPILLLKGNLGAGKTTFTQFLVEKLGSSDQVSSPTYAIVNEYDTKQGKIFHFDLYRMKNIDEVYQIGIFDYLDHGYLSIIEWPEIFEQEFLNLPHHTLFIENNQIERKLIFK